MKYNCAENKHKYTRQGVCELCNTKNPKVWGNPQGGNRWDGMPLFKVKFEIYDGEHETTIRANAQYTAETRIRTAIRDLFGGSGGGKILEIKKIKQGGSK